MGPTASGKTDLAIALSAHLDIEIISVDSALVYRGMNIGTAKPTEEELARVPHRLIDIRDPADPYSAADFCKDARREIKEITSLGRTPVLAGGTMLYFKALLDGLSEMPASDETVREEINRKAERLGWPSLHRELAELDPVAAERIHPNHSQRISRALEVHRLSGVTMTEWQARGQNGLLADYDWVQFAIAPRDRQVLHSRINRRFEEMVHSGFIDEVRQFWERDDLHKDLPSIRAVGYRQVWEYLDGHTCYDEMLEKGKAATRQLAKRQLTWLRGWPSLSWLYTQSEKGEHLSSGEILNNALNFLAKRSI